MRSVDSMRGRKPAFLERREARALGAKTFTGAECPICGGADYYVSNGQCVACLIAKGQQRYRVHQTRIAAVDAERYFRKRGAERPSPNEPCACCGRPVRQLVWDHDHALAAAGVPIAETFRGWICHRCNHGLAMLGDNIAGLEQAIAYLRRAAAGLNEKEQTKKKRPG